MVPVAGGGVGVTVLPTVTLRVAVALPPAVSVTVSDSVCETLLSLVVSSAYEALLPLTVCVDTTAPSTASENVREADEVAPPVVAIPTVVVPPSVAPEAGLVNAAVRTGVGDVRIPFFTLTLVVPVPMLLDESLTVATSGCVPSTTILVSYGIDTGPLLDVVIDPIGLPPS